jgi:hypothetical protein
MKIKKNGVTINLTESDIKKLSKRILKEQNAPLQKIDYRAKGTLKYQNNDLLDYVETLGGVDRVSDAEIQFIGPDGKTYSLSMQWVVQIVGEDDEPKWVDRDGKGELDKDFYYLFNDRKES